MSEFLLKIRLKRESLEFLISTQNNFNDELADIVISAAKNNGIQIKKEKLKNPRTEMEKHYYNPKMKV